MTSMTRSIRAAVSIAVLSSGAMACSAEIAPDSSDQAEEEPSSEEAQTAAVRAIPRVLPFPAIGQGTTAGSAECKARCQALIDYYKDVCEDAQCTDADKNNCPILRAKFLSHMACAQARNEFKFFCPKAMGFTPDKGHQSAIDRAVDSANQCAVMFNNKPKCLKSNGDQKLGVPPGLTPAGESARLKCGY